MNQNLPVIVIGAGPVGLATAAHLRERSQEVLVLESGNTAGAAISQWSHIKLFSPWRFNIDAAARRLLETATEGYAGDWEAPRITKLPTGGELVSEYLEPLAAHPELAPRIRYGHRVVKVSRVLEDGRGADKTRTAGRDDAPFLVRTETADGLVDLLGRAVVDASGTWHQPSPVGRAGIPAIGEAEARDQGFIICGLPDPLGVDQAELAGKSLLVLGAGHSAANTIIALGRLQKQYPETKIQWGLRGAANPIRLYGGGAADQLPARGQLGTSLRRLVENGNVELLENVSITSMDCGELVNITLADGRELQADRIIAATGFRPELSMLSELRLDLDESVEAPRQLGPLIDPEFHSCGTVSAHGEKILAHPEKNFYIVGMKSYGRAPTFLMATGYEQVRSIAAALSGDSQAADRVELDLPETGVCSTDLGGSCDAPGESDSDSSCGTEEAVADSCCSGPQPVTLGLSTGTLHGNKEMAGK
ncbi:MULTISPECIES: FAD-dependent oxidoreductase [Glutamicibacter]|uniref:Flavoprotein n=1 Tax=Glutamicibacter arilaitensis TaxID=256701 RepID=A0A2N7RXT7_9MICC|nr:MULTISPECIES: FAD-dependent oxidoreductase [Glutamicibacter]PMQ18709.1 flavoprotein [Glutamicibacter arilaitensis]HCJ55718.1 FAD-dependent oxidoreductase [Glutamicibacter sp.]